MPSSASFLSSSIALFTTGSLSWVVGILVILLIAGIGFGLHRLASYLAEHTQASQAARLVDTLGSVADGIVVTLLQHPPAAPEVLAAVKAAAVAQGVAYVKTTLPDTVAALAVSDTTLAARLSNEVAGSLLGSPAAAVLGQAAGPIAGTIAADVGGTLAADAPALLAGANAAMQGKISLDALPMSGLAAVVGAVASGLPTAPAMPSAPAATTAAAP